MKLLTSRLPCPQMGFATQLTLGIAATAFLVVFLTGPAVHAGAAEQDQRGADGMIADIFRDLCVRDEARIRWPEAFEVQYGVETETTGAASAPPPPEHRGSGDQPVYSDTVESKRTAGSSSVTVVPPAAHFKTIATSAVATIKTGETTDVLRHLISGEAWICSTQSACKRSFSDTYKHAGMTYVGLDMTTGSTPEEVLRSGCVPPNLLPWPLERRLRGIPVSAEDEARQRLENPLVTSRSVERRGQVLVITETLSYGTQPDGGQRHLFPIITEIDTEAMRLVKVTGLQTDLRTSETRLIHERSYLWPADDSDPFPTQVVSTRGTPVHERIIHTRLAFRRGGDVGAIPAAPAACPDCAGQ